MSKKTEEPVTRRVPFRSIYIPGEQIRSDEPETQRLADRLKADGQIYPVLVAEGGPDGKEYTLVEGFRRCAAFVLNGWQNREIEVKVVQSKTPLDRIATNWNANMEREGINFIDQCECVASLVDGTYPVIPGEKAEPVERYEIAQRLGITTGQVSRMLNVKRNVDSDVLSLARKSQAPSYIVLNIAKIEGDEDLDGEKRKDDRMKKQSAVLTAWIDKQNQLKEQGRVRSERSDKGTKKGSKKNGKSAHGKGGKNGKHETVGAVAPEKRVAHATYKDEKERAYSVEDYVTVLTNKTKTIAKDREKKPVSELSLREQVIRLQGIIDGMRFMKGEIKRLPDLTKEDFEVLRPETASAEAE